MPDGLEMTTRGFPELERTLDDMGQSLGEQVCRKALREGGNLMKGAIAANAPERPDLPSGTALPVGALRNDITVTVTKDKGAQNSFSAWIEAGKETFRVSVWVEWGHRFVRGGRYMNWGKRGKGQHVGEVIAHPYIRPAFDANEDLAFEVIAQTALNEINRVAGERGLNAGR
jgi:hypothetical protein